MADAANEHFNLAWNQFESCAASTFKKLLADQDFADVTLACDGDKQVTAHKVILSACSPFFRNILKKNRHQHPLLYLKGVKFRHLELIVKFIYLGQIEIGKKEEIIACNLWPCFINNNPLQVISVNKSTGIW